MSPLQSGIASITPLMNPSELFQLLPANKHQLDFIAHTRIAIEKILYGHDNRLLVIVGPCSIHDGDAALEYANRLKILANQLQDHLFIVMRVYFEKPRTSIGWKGYIRDPHLDGSHDMDGGLKHARKLLLALANMQLPAATEFLDPFIPHYLSDLISWVAIGARTSQSQLHRELASGLMAPVGFKNTTDGNVTIAIEAVKTAAHPHHFIGISTLGVPQIISTTGNKNCHIILRGSDVNSNYHSKDINDAVIKLKEANLNPKLMIDCSHGNSGKEAQNQINVIHDLCQDNKLKETILGVMLESNLVMGRQRLKLKKDLVYGKSITDACIGWDQTVQCLQKLAMHKK